MVSLPHKAFSNASTYFDRSCSIRRSVFWWCSDGLERQAFCLEAARTPSSLAT